jgi:hypothetical protein
MARRQNEMFIGADKLSLEGRAIKHYALIKLFATVNLNKTSENPIDLVGLDLETDAETAELKLLGFWNGKGYSHYRDNFLSVLFSFVKYCYKNDKSLAYWNKLDPFVIFKQFLQYATDTEIENAMQRFGKISGEWDKQKAEWRIHPIIEVEVSGTHFGIIQAIRSSIQFFFYRDGDTDIKKVWAYDIAQLYQYGLEKEATKHLTYYSKVDKSAHIVDWKRFDDDTHYRENIVLKSNELDARAVYDLGYIIQDMFKGAFNFYPRTLISQGSLARSAILATLHKIHDGNVEKITDDIQSIGIINHVDFWSEHFGAELMKDLMCLAFEAYSGGQIESYMYGYAKDAYTVDLAQAYPAHINELLDLRGSHLVKGTGTPIVKENSYIFIRGNVYIPHGIDYHPLTIKHPVHHETNIRATGEYRASYTIEERDFLTDLGATFTNEEWIRIETNGNLSPLAYVSRELIKLREQFRPTGKDYVAKTASASLYGILFEAVDTYIEKTLTKEIDLGADENYYKKYLKPYLKKVNTDFMLNELKYYLGKDYKKVTAMWSSKDNGIHADVIKQELETYGIYLKSEHPVDILLEMDKLYREKPKHEFVKETFYEVHKDGYRGGEFLNPIYATIITSRVRIQQSKAMNEIKKRGGQPILSMTDAVYWHGTADMIPSEMVREPKTVGYFETPEHIKDLVCLGSGRYGYSAFNPKTNEWEKMQSKKRGLNVIDIHDPDGVIVDDFNWLNALIIKQRIESDKIKVKVRTLISVGKLLGTHKMEIIIDDKPVEIILSYKDLGRVVDEYREVDIIVGKQKRVYDDDIKDASILAKQLVQTAPIHLMANMDGRKGLTDHTLPELRRLLMKQVFVSKKEKRTKNVQKASMKYYNKNKDIVNEVKKQQYNQLRDYGYNIKDAKKMASWKMENIQLKLREDGYL